MKQGELLGGGHGVGLRIGAKNGEIDVIAQQPSAVLQEAAQVGCACGTRQKRREDRGKDTAHSYLEEACGVLVLVLLRRRVMMVVAAFVLLFSPCLAAAAVAAAAAAAGCCPRRGGDAGAGSAYVCVCVLRGRSGEDSRARNDEATTDEAQPGNSPKVAA